MITILSLRHDGLSGAYQRLHWYALAIWQRLAIVGFVLSLAALFAMPNSWNMQARNTIGKAMLAPLINLFPLYYPVDLQSYSGIIVLGGSNRRIAIAKQMAAKSNHLLVIVTGADPTEVLSLFEAAGIDKDRVVVDSQSRSTWEDAVQTKALLSDKSSRERWLLVSSDFHLPRAVGCFRRLSIDVSAIPVVELQPGSERWLYHAAHEWIGLFAYWLGGRTSTFLPGPIGRPTI